MGEGNLPRTPFPCCRCSKETEIAISSVVSGWVRDRINNTLLAKFKGTTFVSTSTTATTFPLAVSLTGGATSTSATAANGYATGAGGAVTQITNAATGVTLSKPCGQITTVALTTAAAAEERFTVTNTLVAATDVISLSTTYNGAGTPVLSVQKVAAGAFDIVVTNVHAANAFDAVMVINFAVTKAVAA